MIFNGLSTRDDDRPARIERRFEASHIRRGRLATAPTFFVGWVDRIEEWHERRFQRKRDAESFAALVLVGTRLETLRRTAVGAR